MSAIPARSLRRRRLLLGLATAMLTSGIVGGGMWLHCSPSSPRFRSTLEDSAEYHPTEFSRDGRMLLGTSPHWGFRDRIVWDVPFGRVLDRFRQDPGEATFTPGGRLALLVTDEEVYRRQLEKTGRPEFEERVVLRDVRVGRGCPESQRHLHVLAAQAVTPPTTPSLASAAMQLFTVERFQDAVALGRPTLVARLGLGTPLSFSAEGDLVAARDAGGRLRVWELGTGGSRAVCPTDEEGVRVTDFRFSRASRTLGVAFSDGVVLLWHADTGREQYRVEVSDERRPLQGVLGPDLRKLLTVLSEKGGGRYPVEGIEGDWMSDGRGWRLWSLPEGGRRTRLLIRGIVRPVQFHPDGRLLMWDRVPRQGISQGFDLVYRDMESGEVVAAIPNCKGGIFSPDGDVFAAETEDHGIQLWEIAARDPRWGLIVSLAGVTGLVAGACVWWLSARSHRVRGRR